MEMRLIRPGDRRTGSGGASVRGIVWMTIETEQRRNDEANNSHQAEASEVGGNFERETRLLRHRVLALDQVIRQDIRATAFAVFENEFANKIGQDADVGNVVRLRCIGDTVR